VRTGEREVHYLMTLSERREVEERTCRVTRRAVGTELALMEVTVTGGAGWLHTLEVESGVTRRARYLGVRPFERKSIGVLEFLLDGDGLPGVRAVTLRTRRGEFAVRARRRSKRLRARRNGRTEHEHETGDERSHDQPRLSEGTFTSPR
jgi:hypothetical protein